MTSCQACIPLLVAASTLTASLAAPDFAAMDTRQMEEWYYPVETIPVPKHVTLEVGGMAFMEDGRLMVCTRFGEIWARQGEAWSLFAEGLSEPMGIWPTGPHQVVVAQRPELTRITDTDLDGRADEFETLTDAWNYTGHLYEWTFGPVQDSQGNLWGTLACWFFPTKPYERNPYSGYEMPPPAGYNLHGGAQWRGWSFKYTPEGEFIPWSSGLRSPNGLGWNAEGDLFVTDNQGEYYGACVMHHISRGAFHGHPVSFFWGDEKVEDPFALSLEELNRRRKPPAVIFPYGEMGQSASEPHLDGTRGRFGPFGGQLFVGDQTLSTIMRVALEKVGGQYQGACFPFRGGFQCGVNRLLFASDGSLLVGETDRGWPSVGTVHEGLQRLWWNGYTPMEMLSVQLTSQGFRIHLTLPLAGELAPGPDAFAVRRYHYHYHRAYGSPKVDERPVDVRAVEVAPDRRSLSLELGSLEPGRVYEIRAQGLVSDEGQPLVHPVAYYTLNQLQPSMP